jgi:hypothetical protein
MTSGAPRTAVGGASFQDIDAPAGLSVDEDRRAGQAPAQGEIIDAQDAGDARIGKADRHQGAERRLPGDANAHHSEQPGARAAC